MNTNKGTTRLVVKSSDGRIIRRTVPTANISYDWIIGWLSGVSQMLHEQGQRIIRCRWREYHSDTTYSLIEPSHAERKEYGI